MENKSIQIINSIKEKYGEEITDKYNNNTISEIVINCISLVKTWFSSIKKPSELSYEMVLFDKDGNVSETLHGINNDNLSSALAEKLIVDSHRYSKALVNSFRYINDSKEVKVIGEIEIS